MGIQIQLGLFVLGMGFGLGVINFWGAVPDEQKIDSPVLLVLLLCSLLGSK